MPPQSLSQSPFHKSIKKAWTLTHPRSEVVGDLIIPDKSRPCKTHRRLRLSFGIIAEISYVSERFRIAANASFTLLGFLPELRLQRYKLFLNQQDSFLKKSLRFTDFSPFPWHLFQDKTLFYFFYYFSLDGKVTKRSSAIQRSAATVWRGQVL